MLTDRRSMVRRFWTVIWDNTDNGDEWAYLAGASGSNRVLFISWTVAILGSVAVALILYVRP